MMDPFACSRTTNVSVPSGCRERGSWILGRSRLGSGVGRQEAKESTTELFGTVRGRRRGRRRMWGGLVRCINVSTRLARRSWGRILGTGNSCRFALRAFALRLPPRAGRVSTGSLWMGSTETVECLLDLCGRARHWVSGAAVRRRDRRDCRDGERLWSDTKARTDDGGVA